MFQPDALKVLSAKGTWRQARELLERMSRSARGALVLEADAELATVVRRALTAPPPREADHGRRKGP